MGYFSFTFSLSGQNASSVAGARCAATVDHPTRPGPFYLFMPMNTQAAWLPGFNLDELPQACQISLGAAEADYGLAAQWIREAQRIVVKVGGGGRNADSVLLLLPYGHESSTAKAPRPESRGWRGSDER